MTRVAVVGAEGRMGRRLVALAPEAGLVVGGTYDFDRPLDPAVAPDADLVIDFSVRAQVASTCATCARYGLPLVLGTTGLGPEDLAAVDALAGTVPVGFAPNFSVGVNALFALVAEAAQMLGEGWDVEVVEAHHRHKVDAPSGTAKELVRRIARVRGLDPAAAVRHGREGLVGARGAGEIGMHALRGGSIVGEHRAHFLADGEEIVLEHRALDRDILVRGALRAARWLLADRPAGRYDMGDVLRLA